jgi:hypothetical protein
MTTATWWSWPWTRTQASAPRRPCCPPGPTPTGGWPAASSRARCKSWLWGIKLGRSVIETLFYVLCKRGSLGRAVPQLHCFKLTFKLTGRSLKLNSDPELAKPKPEARLFSYWDNFTKPAFLGRACNFCFKNRAQRPITLYWHLQSSTYARFS